LTEQKEKSMSWIKEYCEGSFSLYAGNTIDAFQPLDFFHFYGLWYDLWVERIILAMEKIGAEQKNYEQLKTLLPVPSSMRALIQKAIPAFAGLEKKNPLLFKRY